MEKSFSLPDIVNENNSFVGRSVINSDDQNVKTKFVLFSHTDWCEVNLYRQKNGN